MKKDFYNKIVLGVLFVFPLVVYLFFASGKNNFAKLPILTSGIAELPLQTNELSDLNLKDKITILGYWGGDLENKKAEAFNLNEKIYKRFFEFSDFQFVFFIDLEHKAQVEALLQNLQEGVGTDISRWNFVSTDTAQIRSHFESLQTPFQLDENASTPYVFIIDKDLNLRGRNDDEDEGTLFGFDARSVAQLNKKMIDDVKVILAEYRLALKIYNQSNREK